jgi:hypothetical protein
MYGAFELARQVAKVKEVNDIVAFPAKAAAAITAALDEVRSDAGKEQSKRPRHAIETSRPAGRLTDR